MTARPDRRGSTPPALFPEGLIGGRFRIGRVLGVGGTATVFEARDETTGEEVAVKAIPRDERLVKRARREIRVAQALDHHAIVRLLHVIDEEDYVYVVFELVRGDDLARTFRDGLLDDAASLRAVAGVCDALAHAHSRGVVHRDVKPGNVLLREDGVLKLTDFGIALIDHPDATADDRLLGTLSYMAPEQAAGRDSGGAADVWAAALMLYEALAGSNPFRAKTPRELSERHENVDLSLAAERPDLPPVVLRHVDRALSREPKKRPTAAELRDALLHGARALERGMVEDPTLDPLDRPAPDRLRHLKRLAIRTRTLPSRLRGRPALRLVPEPGTAGSGVVGRLAAITHAPAALGEDRRAALARTGSAALAAGVASAALNALPFYPAGWAYGLALVVGLLALVRPLLALALCGLLFLPLAGNLSAGLVPVVGLGMALWWCAIAAAPRRGFVPFLAPLAALAAASPLYLLAAGSARRAHVRFVAGASGPVAVTIACGLTGITSPLSGTVPAKDLARRLAGAEDVGLVAQRCIDAVGRPLIAQSLVWGLLALAALPAFRLAGRRLRLFALCWTLAATIGTIAAPGVVGGAVAPVAPAVVGGLVTGILLALRSAFLPAADDGDRPASAA